MLFHLVIQIHHMQDVQQLALILMKSFHLYIKDGSWIHFNSIVLQYVFCQAFLVLILDAHEFLKRFFVICPSFQAGH